MKLLPVIIQQLSTAIRHQRGLAATVRSKCRFQSTRVGIPSSMVGEY
jgi:hypothetical protein